MPTTTRTAVRELDRRTNDGFDVRLMWDPHTARVFVTVHDQRHGDSFTVEADAAHALHAFHHPFAYASHDHDPLSQTVAHLSVNSPRATNS